MRVTFKHGGEQFASSRYRAIIPQLALQALGVDHGKDILIVGKHGWHWEDVTKGYKKVVFDVCDDHFDGRWAEHYLSCCKRADAVSCNSQAMSQRIFQETGRKATIIPDPYEQPERQPKAGSRLLWFGHWSNIGDLKRVWPALRGRDLTVVSNPPEPLGGVTEWSPEVMDQAFDECDIAVIPTGKSLCKSANRAIEATRRGLFVAADPLPAYSEVGVWTHGVEGGIEWALNNPEEAKAWTAKLQSEVREKFNPVAIGKKWKALFASI